MFSSGMDGACADYAIRRSTGEYQEIKLLWFLESQRAHGESDD